MKKRTKKSVKPKKTVKPKTRSSASAKTGERYKKLASFGERIMREAKKIRKDHPSKKWRECVAKAGKSLKGK